ncbi:MAG: ABC transporter permease [Lachnospiraceae bacterium]|nr:ABC transporter permease [Lachnospiraceae bacterium]
MSTRLKRSLLASPYIFWIILFTLIPFIMLLAYAFINDSGALTGEYILAITEPVHLKALWLSIRLSVLCTLICLVLSYPLALCMRSLHLGRKLIQTAIVIIPMWMNFVLRIMSWQIILSKNGILNTFLAALGLPPQDLGNSVYAIMIGMVYDYLPFMLLPIYNSVASVGNDVLEAAQDLGAEPLKVLFRIMLPLTMPGIISGIVMVFTPALTTFAISDMLGGGKVMLIGNIIEQEFLSTTNWHLGSGLSLTLMIFVLLGIVLDPEE